MADATKLFICSFCEAPVRFRDEQLSRRGKCPKCGRMVVLLENKDATIDGALTSSWYYRRVRLLLAPQEIGPVADGEFLRLARDQQLDATTEVMSPELTGGNWAQLGRINLSMVQQNVEQRSAERLRRERVAERRKKADEENRAKLQRAIRSAIESGSISSSHRQAIGNFAQAAGIPEAEVSAYITRESTRLVREAFEDALADGILEPSEEQQISQLAIALGVELTFSHHDKRKLSLCRLAFDLDSGHFDPPADVTPPFKTAAKEVVLSHAKVKWHEIAVLKRPQGIPIGGDNYLKLLGTGEGFLTTKQVTMVGELSSQKLTLSSVQKVVRFTDGVLFNRSSGKSVFLEMDTLAESGGRFALLAEHACSGDPVLGFDPERRFVPEIVDAKLVEPRRSEYIQRHDLSEPRYTFRVVGDHVGQRAAYIRALRHGEPIQLVREPTNAHDPNAVALYDNSRRQLGYLKREVAHWFSPILRSKPVAAKVHSFTPAGSLVVGVYL